MHQVCALSHYTPLHVFDVQSLRGGVAIRRPLDGLGIAPNIRTVVVTLLSACTPRLSAYGANLEGTGRTQLYSPRHLLCMNSSVFASSSLTSSLIFFASIISMFLLSVKFVLFSPLLSLDV